MYPVRRKPCDALDITIAPERDHQRVIIARHGEILFTMRADDAASAQHEARMYEADPDGYTAYQYRRRAYQKPEFQRGER